ncbi:MAG TPA: hypothetical protein PKH50_01465 [bacterium]|jgi:cell division ATPase FtsA|nr:hypothetical protein [bacterium]
MINLPSLKKEHEEPNKFLSLNINARDVKCLSFYPDEDVFKIIGAWSQKLPGGSVRNGMIIDEDTVVEAVKNSVDKVQSSESETKIKKTIVGVDGGITTGLTTVIRMKRPTADPIQLTEVENLYEHAAEAAMVQARNRILENTGDSEMPINPITTSDIYIKIDGQKVALLEGQRGQNVEIAIFNAYVPVFHVKSLQKVTKRAGLITLAIGSQMYSLVEFIKMEQPETKDFVLVNISEDSTDVGAVFGGGIVSTRTLNVGYMHFIQDIGSKMALEKENAESVLKMYNSEKLSKSELPVIKNCLGETIDVWMDGLELLLEDFPGVKTFPPKVYLSGCGADIKDLMEAIKGRTWTKTIPFIQEPEFNNLASIIDGKIVNLTDQELTSEWAYLASTAMIYKEITEV